MELQPLEVFVRIPGVESLHAFYLSTDGEGPATARDLKALVAQHLSTPSTELRISRAGGWDLLDSDFIVQCNESESQDTLSPLHPAGPVFLDLSFRLRGGKGGFGSNLRALGGRMSSQKTENKDACRDLQGRRLKTVNEAKKLAEYAEKEEERKKKDKERIEKKIAEGLKEPEKKKIRFDDAQFVADHEKVRDDVKDAVAKGLQKALSKGTAATATKTAVVAKKPAKSIWNDDEDSEEDSDNGAASSGSSVEKPENKPENKGHKRKASS